MLVLEVRPKPAVSVKRGGRVLLVLVARQNGEYTEAWFRITSRHRTKRGAQARAVQLRQDGWLARVVWLYEEERWAVARRRPRLKEPASWMLQITATD